MPDQRDAPSRSPDVAAVLRRSREAAGLLQVELARILGISVWTLNRVEHGTRRFDSDWLPMMPPAIREPVAQVLIRGYSDQISQVRGHASNAA